MASLSSSDDETEGGTGHGTSGCLGLERQGAVLLMDIDTTDQEQKGEILDKGSEDETKNKAKKETGAIRCRRACANTGWVARRGAVYAHRVELDRGHMERRRRMEVARQLCL